MIIDVLVCRIDGTQAVEQREVPDNWFESPDVPEENNKQTENIEN